MSIEAGVSQFVRGAREAVVRLVTAPGPDDVAKSRFVGQFRNAFTIEGRAALSPNGAPLTPLQWDILRERCGELAREVISTPGVLEYDPDELARLAAEDVTKIRYY